MGYQSTLLTEVASLEERILSTRQGSITSVQAVYVPGRRHVRPGGERHHEPSEHQRYSLAQTGGEGHLPGGRSCVSSSRMMDRHILGDRHYNVAMRVREHLARYRELEDIIPLGMEELSGERIV